MLVKAGVELDAWCTKCRMDLSHRVVAVVAGAPKRVECLTCHTQHNYRSPKGASNPLPRAAPSKTSSGGKRPTKAEAQLFANWESRVQGRAQSAFTNYSIDQSFEVEQLVRHKKFGEGYVAERLGENKITVVFRSGPKTLIHGRG